MVKVEENQNGQGPPEDGYEYGLVCEPYQPPISRRRAITEIALLVSATTGVSFLAWRKLNELGRKKRPRFPIENYLLPGSEVVVHEGEVRVSAPMDVRSTPFRHNPNRVGIDSDTLYSVPAGSSLIVRNPLLFQSATPDPAGEVTIWLAFTDRRRGKSSWHDIAWSPKDSAYFHIPGETINPVSYRLQNYDPAAGRLEAEKEGQPTRLAYLQGADNGRK